MNCEMYSCVASTCGEIVVFERCEIVDSLYFISLAYHNVYQIPNRMYDDGENNNHYQEATNQHRHSECVNACAGKDKERRTTTSVYRPHIRRPQM